MHLTGYRGLRPLAPESDARRQAAQAITPARLPDMHTRKQIEDYIAAQPELKRGDMHELHRVILAQMPKCKLWFLDGRNDEGKVVSNPSVGYGLQTIKYADGSARESYQVGMSVNTTGISIYILGLKDKAHLAHAYGKELGKASVTGYCIKFKRLEDIHIDVLCAAIGYGVAQTNTLSCGRGAA